ALAETDPVFERCFDGCQPGWRKLSDRCQRFQRSVTEASRNQRDHTCCALKCKIDRALRPMQCFLFIEEWRPYEYKNSQPDCILPENLSPTRELFKRHPLVQFFQHFGMGGLQAHGDLQFC